MRFMNLKEKLGKKIDSYRKLLNLFNLIDSFFLLDSITNLKKKGKDKIKKKAINLDYKVNYFDENLFFKCKSDDKYSFKIDILDLEEDSFYWQLMGIMGNNVKLIGRKNPFYPYFGILNGIIYELTGDKNNPIKDKDFYFSAKKGKSYEVMTRRRKEEIGEEISEEKLKIGLQIMRMVSGGLASKI